MQRHILAASVIFVSLALPALAGSPGRPQALSTTNARSDPAAENLTVTASIRKILEHGFRPGQAGVQDAGSQVRAAGRGEDTDPRVPFAYGIVLLKHFKYRDALEQFTIAAETGNGAYLPAWKARIRTRFLLKQYDAGLTDSEELARRLQHRSFPWSESKSRSGAHWLGRVIGYFSLSEVNLVKSQALSSREAILRKILGEELKKAFDGGQASIRHEYDKQHVDLKLASAAMKAEHKDKLKKQSDKLESRTQLLKDQAETVELTANEWRGWLEEQLELTEKQLSVLNKDYAVLDAAASAISRQINEVQLEINRLSLQSQFSSRKRERESDRRYENSIQLLNNQLRKYQSQYYALVQRSQGVLAQARSVIANRFEAQQRYKNATGQLLKTDKTLQKWSTVLKKAKNKHAEQATKQSPQAQKLARRLIAISTYLPLEPEAQKQLLLEEIDLIH